MVYSMNLNRTRCKWCSTEFPKGFQGWPFQRQYCSEKCYKESKQ